MTVVLLRRGAARDATEFEDAHLVVVVVVVAFLRLVGLVLFIFEDEDEAHTFAKDETAVAAQNMVFLRRSHSLSLEEQLFVRATCPRERKNSAVLFLSLRKKCAKGEREPPREVKNTPQTQGKKIKAKKKKQKRFRRVVVGRGRRRTRERDERAGKGYECVHVFTTQKRIHFRITKCFFMFIKKKNLRVNFKTKHAYVPLPSLAHRHQGV